MISNEVAGKVPGKRIRHGLVLVIAFIFMGLQQQRAVANDMHVTNVVLSAGDAGYTFVKFDISWKNSWKASWIETAVTPNITVTNWDAAWIFVKYRFQGGDWQHASLSITNNEHTAPAGSIINAGVSTNSGGTNFGTGVYLYRAAEGNGPWTNSGVKLRWNYGQDGVLSTARVDVSVHAIEMVYVPRGSFKVGSGGGESGSFTEGSWVSGATIPYEITSENALMVTNAAGGLWGTNPSGVTSVGSTGVLSAAFPKGFNAFYCMKYEISQGQWVAFFNSMTDSQKTTRDITGATGKNTDSESNRNTVAWLGVGNDATCTAPDRACNFINWADGVAYADWAGLRPMTELEYEKACRGPLPPVANEYAWGDTTLTAITNFAGAADGSGVETALPATANCCYNNTSSVQGPVRCGIFATATSGRSSSGATYWGIMEMSGNVWERPVTLGDATGRLFTGTIGDGRLDSNGNANADFWPDITATGAGFRGGKWDYSGYIRVSERGVAAYSLATRSFSSGFRAVGPAP